MQAQPNYKSIHKTKQKIYFHHKIVLLLTFQKQINQFSLILRVEIAIGMKVTLSNFHNLTYAIKPIF